MNTLFVFCEIKFRIRFASFPRLNHSGQKATETEVKAKRISSSLQQANM